MLLKTHCADYVVHIKQDGNPYLDIFNDFLNNRVHVTRVFRNIEDTKVMLVEHLGQPYVLKVFKPKGKEVERFLKSFVKGDYYLNLMKKTNELWSQGTRFQNDFYLLAEKKIFNYASLYIMIIEYIPGTELSEYAVVSDEIKHDIVTNLKKLHQQGMVSGDPHKGNFIVSENGLRIIDLSGKKLTKRLVAKDFIDIERHIGIDDFKKDFFYHWVIKRALMRKRFKAFKQSLKGK